MLKKIDRLDEKGTLEEKQNAKRGWGVGGDTHCSCLHQIGACVVVESLAWTHSVLGAQVLIQTQRAEAVAAHSLTNGRAEHAMTFATLVLLGIDGRCEFRKDASDKH